jgi:hypothetical protein
VSFTAQVSPNTATGVIQFRIDGNDFGPPVPLTNGTATSAATALLTAGSHAVSAVYGGDNTFAGSTGALTQVVNQAAATSTITSSVNPSVFGQVAVFTAAVTSAGGIPNGTVTFKDGSATLGAVALDASGYASFATPALVAGIHSITAAYGGGNNFIISTSAPLGQVVAQANTATSVTVSTVGQTVTLTAATLPVAPGAGLPTGAVTFKDGLTVLGTMTLNGSGQATFPTTTLAMGTHSITATYSGDANFVGSTSAVYPACDVNLDGSTNVADVQVIINQALGVSLALNDLNGDGAVNVADVQVVINGALGLGCTAGPASLANVPNNGQ